MPGSMPQISNDPSTTDGRGAPARARWHRTRQRGVFHGRNRTADLVIIAAVAATLLIGFAAGADPLLVVGGLAGLAVMTVVLTNVTAGLMVFVFVAFAAAGTPSLAKIVGLFLVLGWLGAVAVGRPGDRASLDFLDRNLLLAAGISLFLTWALASQIWAEDVAVARETFIRYALNFVLFPVVYVAIRTPRHIVMLFAVYVVGALVVAAVGFRAGGDDSGRLSGGGLNPNELGTLLTVGAVLAFTLAGYRRIGSAARLVALGSGLLCTVAVFLTGSRGALVALAVSIVAAPFLLGPGRRLLAAVLVVVGGAALAVWVSLFAPADTLERFTLADGGSGRVDLWTVALRMFNDKPVAGVGAGNYPVSSIHYLLEPGVITRPEYFIDRPKVPHNIYLQVLTEMGVVGITLFLAVIVTCFVIAWRAAVSFYRQGDRPTELLTRGLLIALVGLLAAGFFSSALYSKQMYVLLAAAPPIFAMAIRHARLVAKPEAPR